MIGDRTDLTLGPLLHRFRDIASPAAVGMLFSTLYTVVDVYFAGMVSTQAQAGLAVAFQPFMMLMTFGIGLGSAMSALVGGAHGAGDRAQARALALQGPAYGALASVGLIALGLTAGPLVLSLTSTPGAYRELGLQYLAVICFALPGFVLAFAVNGVLQALGDAVSMQRALIAAFVANIALNPLLTFGAPGVWEGLGLPGIAAATVLSQSGVALFLVWRASRLSLLAEPRWAEAMPRAMRLRAILTQQIPASAAMLVLMAASVAIQFYLKRFGAEAVAA